MWGVVRVRIIILAVGASSLAACTAGVDCDGLGQASLALGEGERSFSPIAEGHRFDQEFGPQGGSHVWVALQATGIWPGRLDLLGDDQAPQVAVTLTGDQSGSLFGPPQRVFLGAREPYELAGLQLRLAPPRQTTTEEPEVPEGPPRLWARVTDVCGTEVETELTVAAP